jgi:hypothetical protein
MKNRIRFFGVLIALLLVSACESTGNARYFSQGEKKAVWISPAYRQTTQTHSEYEDIYINE